MIPMSQDLTLQEAARDCLAHQVLAVITDASLSLIDDEIAALNEDKQARDAVMWLMLQEGNTSKRQTMMAQLLAAGDSPATTTLGAALVWLQGDPIGAADLMAEPAAAGYSLARLLTLCIGVQLPAESWAQSMTGSLTYRACLTGRQ